MESNDFQPCTNFVTSCLKASLADIRAHKDKKRTDKFENLLDKLGSNIANDIELSLINDSHVREKIRRTFAVTTIESIAVCKDTLVQAESPIWYEKDPRK